MSLAQYKQFKKTADEDKDRGDLNAHKAGLVGAVAGVLAKRKAVSIAGHTLPALSVGKRALAGYAAGQLAVRGIRVATSGTKDTYGDRSRTAKKAEKLPFYVGAVGAGLLAKDRLMPHLTKAKNALAKAGAAIRNPTVHVRFDSHNQHLLRMDLHPKKKARGGVIPQGPAPCEFSALDFLKSRPGLRAGLALTGGIATADAVTHGVLHDKNESTPHAIAAGAGQGLLYGGALAASEPAYRKLIDVLTKSRAAKTLEARLVRPVLFHYANQARIAQGKTDKKGGKSLGGAFISHHEAYATNTPIKVQGEAYESTPADLIRSTYNKGRSYAVVARRGHGLISDAVGAARGIEKTDSRGRPLKREWEKQWFKNAVTGAAIGAGVLGVSVARRYGRKNPNTAIGHGINETEKKIVKGVARTKEIGRNIATRAGKAIGLEARTAGEILFDLHADIAGWDVRDPRGRSARVFAPGARQRDRRPKKWHEKVENIRKLAIAGTVTAGAAGLLGGFLLAGGRKVPVKPRTPRVRKPAAAALTVLPFSQPAHA